MIYVSRFRSWPMVSTRNCLRYLFTFFLLSLPAILPGNTSAQPGISLKGTADYWGSELPANLTFDQKGRFKLELGGWANQVSCFDGQKLWRTEEGNGPIEIDFLEKELYSALGWLLKCGWDELDDNERSSAIQIYDGRLEWKFFGDENVRSLTATNSPGNEKVTIAGIFPLDETGQEIRITIKSHFALQKLTLKLQQPDALDGDWFEKPAYQTSGVKFDRTKSSSLEVRQAKSGHLFIKASVDGTEPAWFLFDSGASVSIINSEWAADRDYKVVGKKISGGVGGSTGERPLCEIPNVVIGPLSIDRLHFVQSPGMMKMASQILGEEVRGVFGWDLLVRSVVQVDMNAGKIELFEPKLFHSNAKEFEPVHLHWNVPYLPARFEGDRRGFFMLDTGAGNRGPIFHSLAVDRLNLLANRETTDAAAAGAGGQVSIKIGTLEWFEIAGIRTKEMTSYFMVGKDGEADLFTDGFLGGLPIKGRKIIFDYPRQRIGFVK